MMLALDDRRPAYLTEVRAALTALPEADQARLGVTEDWKTGPHQLTYRQTEHTFGLIARALSKDEPDGAPSGGLQPACDHLLEASIPAAHKNTSTALAADWTDVETWSRPPRHGSTDCADPEAPGDTATPTSPAPKARCSSATTCRPPSWSRDENGPAVPELARRITLSGCDHDPVRALAAVLTAHARRRHPARRHHRRLRLRPPRRRSLGHPAPRRRRPARPGPAPARPRPPGNPPRRHHRQRKPLLPRHAQAAAETRAPAARRHPPSRSPPTTSRPPS